LREMPLTVLVDREGRIAISHAGVVDHWSSKPTSTRSSPNR
jgi:hypothetical protein